MSEYAQYEGEYLDKECLVNALVEQGYAKEHIEVHEQPQQLIDYHGQATHYLDPTGDKAEIIVRRKHVGGAANDLGFKKQENEKYAPVISNYDTGKHNTKWLSGLKDRYHEQVATKQARKMGLKLKSRTVVNGKVVVRYLQA
jgi:Protein of unknown function (DUF1257)